MKIIEAKIIIKKYYILIGLCLLTLVCTFIYLNRPPIIISIVKDGLKKIDILRLGEEKYIEKIINKQILTNKSIEPSTRILETALLPINIKFVSLPNDFAVAGGALAKINNKLLVMSRTGLFYYFESGIFSKLDYQRLPSNIDNYIINSKQGLSSDAFRAISFAYDMPSQRIFVGYTKYIDSKTNKFAISSLKVDPITLEQISDWKLEYESDLIDSKIHSHSGGGRLLIENSVLYFSVGYSGIITSTDGKKIHSAQDPKTSFGKVFKLDIKSGQIELLSMGHRNVQGLTLSRSGDLLATEHGPQGGDEINIVVKGANFGWPYKTYGTDYGNYTYKSTLGEPIFFKSNEPMYSFVPSIGLSPIHTIKNFHPSWNDDILIGSLKAQSLYRLLIRNGRVLLSEPIWIGHRIRDILIIQEIGIVLLTDNNLLAFLTVNEGLLKVNKKNAGYNFEPKIQSCLVCHHFEQSTPTSLAPSLANIIGRKMGIDSFVGYSDAMKRATGSWNEEELSAFLINPQSIVPGTSMPNPGLSSNEVNDIVKILNK